MARHRRRTGAGAAQWVVLIGLFSVIGFGVFYASHNPETEWGPIVIGAMGLLGLIVRRLFPADTEEDDYAPR